MTITFVQITRRFDAPPERVFDAWVDPKKAYRWLFTSPTSETHSTEMEARVGGKWSITDRRDGVDYTALGEYLEIDRPRRLLFTFGMPQFSPEFTRVIVEIAADGAGSILTLTQEGVPEAHAKATEEGWGKMFDGLEAALVSPVNAARVSR